MASSSIDGLSPTIGFLRIHEIWVSETLLAFFWRRSISLQTSCSQDNRGSAVKDSAEGHLGCLFPHHRNPVSGEKPHHQLLRESHGLRQILVVAN